MSSKQRAAFVNLLTGDETARLDAIKAHTDLKEQLKGWLQSPIGMWMQELLDNPNSQFCAALKDRACITLQLR